MVSEWLIVIAVLSGAVAIICFGFRRIRRRELAEIQRFRQFAPKDEDGFLASLGLTSDTPDALTATVLRAAIAELGEVPASSIRAEHRFYPDLERLPFYDSIDLIGLILTVEEKIGIQLGETQIERIEETVMDGTVADFVLTVLRCQQDEQR